MNKFTESDLSDIINYQMDLNGYSERYLELKVIENWYSQFTTTKAKEEQFKKYLREKLKPFVPKVMLERYIGRFLLQY